MTGNKKTFLLRKVLIGAIIAIFAYISIVFIYQFTTYQKVKERLDAAYALGLQRSSLPYHLFSLYGEADNLFRQYTIDFNEDVYHEYREKLDTIKYYVDSLSTLSDTDHVLQQSNTDMQKRDFLANEFASIRRTVDHDPVYSLLSI